MTFPRRVRLTVLKGTQMQINGTMLYGPRLSQLYCPREEASRAAKARLVGNTANQVRDEITNTIYDWHADGGLIATVGRYAAEIDMTRLEYRGERTAYSMDNKVIILGDAIELVRVEDSFGSNTRRTLNRHFEKIGNPSSSCVDRRLIPGQFWEEVALRVIEYRKTIT